MCERTESGYANYRVMFPEYETELGVGVLKTATRARARRERVEVEKRCKADSAWVDEGLRG